MESLDGVVQGFYDGCASAPQNCELAQLANTSEAIAGLVNSALESLRYSPVVVTLNESSTTITYTDVKNKMFSSMYSPAKWRSQAKLLTRLIQGNYTGYVGLLKKASGGADDRDTPDAILGISCGDAAYRAKSIMDMNEYKDAVVATSQWGGLDFGLINTLSCAPWQMKAKEVYAGPWNAETKSPLLIIGNSYDPVTPLVSAQYNNEVFGGSALLQQNGYGVCSAHVEEDFLLTTHSIVPWPSLHCAQPNSSENISTQELCRHLERSVNLMSRSSPTRRGSKHLLPLASMAQYRVRRSDLLMIVSSWTLW